MKRAKSSKPFDRDQLLYKLQKLPARLGVDIEIFYLVDEGDFNGAPDWPARYAAYETCLLSREEMALIAPTHPWDDLDGLCARHDRGDLCVALKQEGRVAAFTWANLLECNHRPLTFDMAGDEAYLYDAFTLPEFRGRGLAPYMRYRCYEQLKSMGRERFYSISAYFNKPSIRFKQKLNASFDKLYISLAFNNGDPYTWNIKNR